jgi:flagellar hook-associated protein 1 FlgK
MGVGFASYEIARSGLTVNERGLYVTGHNISNVNTPGYVRQQAMIKNGPVESYYTRAGLMQYGLGSDIQDIRQIRHVFLDNVFRQENTTLGYWESRRKTFQDVEAIMAEPIESGLQNMLNNFWDSWQELSKEPESLTVRALVRQRSEALVQHINHMGEQLDRLQSDLNTEIAVRIDEVNEITRQIASLNVTILRNEINSDSANDYRDQRNSLIDRLTKLVKADVNEMQDGQVDISVGGYFLVQKGVSRDLYAAERNAGENFYVAKLAGTNTEVPLNSGIIKGLMESRGEVSGAIGSYENGAPNTNVDVVFYVDTSTMSAAEAATRMNIYSQWLSDRGLNANVMMREVGSAAEIAGQVASETLQADARKYAILVTNGTLTNPDDMDALQEALANKGMDASVVTNSPSTWSKMTRELGGTTYSLADFANADTDEYTKFASEMAMRTNADMGHISSSTNIVSDMKARLNALVNIMLREVNYLHRNGKTMKDPPTDGDDFFVSIIPGRPLEMGNIRLNSNLSDLANIASSKTGESGDNSNALQIANLRNAVLVADSAGVASLDDYYQDIILHMGNNGTDAMNITDSQNKLVQSADAQRTAITGVSMDEEMTNMMKFKFAYDASSRVLNIIDSMIETVVNRLGLVGR